MEQTITSKYRTEPIQKIYDIDEELGRGSFSVVYRAKHKTTGKDYAVKIVDKKKLGSKKLEMVEVEITLLRTVGKHPNIVFLDEVFESEHNVFLVMELITGGELFDKIVELQSYSEKDASRVVKHILSAVDHIHSLHIVHRDLKPENLLLSSASQGSEVKLADFGLSCFLPKQGKLSKAVGTPGYIAPEILQTLDGNLDGYMQEVDCWSVGVIMYILLCGFPPFYAEDDDEAFDQIIAGEFEFPEQYWGHISSEAKDLIKQLLVVDPSKRFNTKQALNHPWIVSNTQSIHLTTTIELLKKFHAKKKWKQGINTVIAMGRFKNLKIDSKSRSRSLSSSPTSSVNISTLGSSPTSLLPLASKLLTSSPAKSPTNSPKPRSNSSSPKLDNSNNKK